MFEEKDTIKKIFTAFKFILYNDYQELETDLQNEYGEISSHIMNIIIGIFEYIKRNPSLLQYLKNNFPEFWKGGE